MNWSTSDIQRPTIGRIVHFTGDDGSGPYAAIVTAIDGRNPERVALATFGEASIYFQGDACYSASRAHGTWRWPPRDPPPPDGSVLLSAEEVRVACGAIAICTGDEGRPPSLDELKALQAALLRARL